MLDTAKIRVCTVVNTDVADCPLVAQKWTRFSARGDGLMAWMEISAMLFFAGAAWNSDSAIRDD
jgi:hypothetical protein